MTLHVITRTPNHILTVSDRMISTSGGYIELDDDRFKHVTLQTDDAHAVISFAGFAGILNGEGGVTETTVDWLTGILRDTMEAGHHGIDQHLNDIRDQTNKYIGNLRKKYPTWDLRLAILIVGWTGPIGFGCVIDNCIKERWQWEQNARDSFTTRIRRYAGTKFKGRSTVAFLCNERLALRQRPLIKLLRFHTNLEDIEAMFDASVKIIRAASMISNGTIGEKCSGICISRHTPGFRALHDRVDPKIWSVIPNHVTSMSRLKLVHWNDEVHRPKPAAKLIHLVTPVAADTPRKRLAFWHRARERLRLLHNEQGAKARNSKSRTAIDRFHEWQRKHFNPVNEAASNELNQAKLHMQVEDPGRYGTEVKIDTSLTQEKKFQMTSEGSYVTDWGPDLFDDPFLSLKMEDRFDTTWDKEIELSDVSPFFVGESNQVPISQDYLDELIIIMNEGLQLQHESNNLCKEADELDLSEVMRNLVAYDKRFDVLIIRLISLDCPEKYFKLRDYLLDFFTFTQASTYFYSFFIKARTVGLPNEAGYFYGKSMDFHDKTGNALDLASEETKRLTGISKD